MKPLLYIRKGRIINPMRSAADMDSCPVSVAMSSMRLFELATSNEYCGIAKDERITERLPVRPVGLTVEDATIWVQFSPAYSNN